jgi:beta-phosphoglucomutase-like phosphatase (HAD superfamily)
VYGLLSYACEAQQRLLTPLCILRPVGVVVEDAPTGIRSGKAAGAIVLATCTSHTRESLEKEKPDFLVEDLSQYALFPLLADPLCVLILPA